VSQNEAREIAARVVQLSEELRLLAIAGGDAVEEAHGDVDAMTTQRCAVVVAALAARCGAVAQELSQSAGKLSALADCCED
jgi:hypothetical protein